VTNDDNEGDDGGAAATEAGDEEDAGLDNDLSEREAA
jgi:hypothetical protein